MTCSQPRQRRTRRRKTAGMQTHRAGNPDRKHRSKNSKAEIRSGNLERGIIRHRAGAPGKCPARFAVSVNDTIKCNRKKKRSSYESLVGSPSTVSREIRRNCTHMYDMPTNYPHTAQKKYLLRRSYCHRGMFRSQATIEYINEKLKATWSPEQIACTPCGLKMPSRTHGVPPVMLPKPSRVRGSA